MMKLAIVLFVGAATGFVAGAITTADSPAEAPAEAPVAAPVGVYFDESAPVDERLAALERTVAEERDARLVLEDQITLLLEEIDRIDTAGPEVLASRITELQSAQQITEARAAARSEAERRRSMSQRELQHSALTQGGFAPDRADQILERVSALQWELMQENYEARQSGTPVDRSGLERNPDWLLRQELGDAEYEQYLNALRRPTQVSVENVMASSPASRAGVQNGDVILSYNGTRIFNSTELRSFAMGGDASASGAVLEVLRDGNRIQLAVPAGPMGVQVAGRSTNGRQWRSTN